MVHFSITLSIKINYSWINLTDMRNYLINWNYNGNIALKCMCFQKIIQTIQNSKVWWGIEGKVSLFDSSSSFPQKQPTVNKFLLHFIYKTIKYVCMFVCVCIYLREHYLQCSVPCFICRTMYLGVDSILFHI